ncbi:MAG TPA: hypothetical protein VI914_06815, partial [Thermodesulfobacteriota bacterium]|nr:hypothetical protein [Thermodesulfobacteriota bacterium]
MKNSAIIGGDSSTVRKLSFIQLAQHHFGRKGFECYRRSSVQSGAGPAGFPLQRGLRGPPAKFLLLFSAKNPKDVTLYY